MLRQAAQAALRRQRMRHSYVKRPQRLPSARAIARPRSRALPFVLALPLVALLWVTIGLPILSNVTSASAGDRRSRNGYLQGAGQAGKSGSQAGETVSVATFSQAVLQTIGITGTAAAPVGSSPPPSPL